MKDSLQDRVVVAGHICLDMIPRFGGPEVASISELLRPGVLVNVEKMVFSTGGSVSNTGVALKLFGCEVSFAARVGDDIIGSLIIEELGRHGATGGIRVSRGEGSSYTIVLAAPGIDRIFLHCPGTNDTFVAADIDYCLLEDAKLFHFGYPPIMRRMFAAGGRELARVFRQAKERGVATSLDMAMPDPASESGRIDWREVYEKTLPYVDIFLPSIEEAFCTLYPEKYPQLKNMESGKGFAELLDPALYESIAREFLNLGCGMVALKAGPLGWYFKSSKTVSALGRLGLADRSAWTSRELWCPAYLARDIASATGSGDASIAGFLAALLRGKSPEECLHLANCAGYHNLSGLDALSGLESWERMESDSSTLELSRLSFLEQTEWRYRCRQRIWERTAQR
jgi:sugar/nucleoside kinase (ribokinase family)